MDTTYCDVIDCPSRAHWISPKRGHQEQDELLCQDCFDSLMLLHPELALDYLPLSELIPFSEDLDEISGDKIVVQRRRVS